MRPILAAVDATESGEHVVRAAARLAEWLDTDVHFIHALESMPALGWQGATARFEAASTRKRLEALVLAEAGPRPAASVELRVGKPADVVLARAEQVNAAAIVMGPHRGSATQARFLGTTAERVVRQATCPCLVIAGALKLPMERVGVATDFSASAEPAARAAAAWAVAAGAGPGHAATLYLLHVGWPVLLAEDPHVEERLLAPQLAEVGRKAVQGSGLGDPATRIIWSNETSTAIADWAEQERLDLLVLGTQGESGISRALLGSVAWSATRQAKCPVLLVPPALVPDDGDDGGA